MWISFMSLKLAVREEEIIFQSLNFDDDLEDMKNQEQFSWVFFEHEPEDFQTTFAQHELFALNRNPEHGLNKFHVWKQFGCAMIALVSK